MEDGTDEKGGAVGGASGTGERAGGVPGGELQAQAGGGQAQPGAGGAAAGGGGKEARQDTGDSGAENGITKIGKDYFAAVYIPATPEETVKGIPSGVVKLSEQEAAVLRAFMRTADYEKTAREVQTNKDEPIKVESVKRILRRPHLRRWLNYQIRLHTVPEIMNQDFCKVELAPVWAGAMKPTDDQKWAMNAIIKLVQPKGVGVQVNVQQNSIYGNMGREAVDAEWIDARAAAAEGL